MKGKDTRGYRGYPPAAACNWLRVDFDDGGKPDCPEKNPHTKIDWNSVHIRPPVRRVEPGSQRWEARSITAKPPLLRMKPLSPYLCTQTDHPSRRIIHESSYTKTNRLEFVWTDDSSACPYLYTDGSSDELPLSDQVRPKRMICLWYEWLTAYSPSKEACRRLTRRPEGESSTWQ